MDEFGEAEGTGDDEAERDFGFGPEADEETVVGDVGLRDDWGDLHGEDDAHGGSGAGSIALSVMYWESVGMYVQ